MKRIIRQISDHAEAAKQPEKRFFIRTGLTRLNLALSDRTRGGFIAGKIGNIIGDSSSGKTFVALGILAECANDTRLDEYDLIHDDTEAANEFDVVKLFGNKSADRIQPPSLDKENPGYSETMTDFQANVRRRLKSDRPFIYILDSFDALTADEEIEHADAVEKAREKGTEAKGSYGMHKAKQASILLRLLVSEVSKTKSLILIISQTRDNIDPMSFQKRTRSGGKALTFYCSYEMWTAVESKITTEVGAKKKKVGIGVVCRMKITKNRCTGKVREVSIPIYFNYGPDDLGSCVDYLIDEGIWPKKNGQVSSSFLPAPTTRTKLIKAIEDNGQEKDLRSLVGFTWALQEAELEKTERKPRYGND